MNGQIRELVKKRNALIREIIENDYELPIEYK